MHYIGSAASAVIAAPIETLWAIVSDVTRHPELAGSGEVQHTWLLTPAPVQHGSLFESAQLMRGLRYSTVSRVVAFEPPHRLAWRVGVRQFPGRAQVWQFALTPQENGTLVQNSVALPYVFPRIWPLSLLLDIAAQHEVETMRPTLINLAQLAGAPPPIHIEHSLRAPESTAALLPAPIVQRAVWVAGAIIGVLLVLRRLNNPSVAPTLDQDPV